mmetsp:Transcript_9660/g.21458  ORF Transcript_9660/g.21458 Transcript_9660/m.21458 type:complete len:1625 (-) Transcript_9660:290-5164(-)
MNIQSSRNFFFFNTLFSLLAIFGEVRIFCSAVQSIKRSQVRHKVKKGHYETKALLKQVDGDKNTENRKMTSNNHSRTINMEAFLFKHIKIWCDSLPYSLNDEDKRSFEGSIAMSIIDPMVKSEKRNFGPNLLVYVHVNNQGKGYLECDFNIIVEIENKSLLVEMRDIIADLISDAFRDSTFRKYVINLLKLSSFFFNELTDISLIKLTPEPTISPKIISPEFQCNDIVMEYYGINELSEIDKYLLKIISQTFVSDSLKAELGSDVVEKISLKVFFSDYFFFNKLRVTFGITVMYRSGHYMKMDDKILQHTLVDIFTEKKSEYLNAVSHLRDEIFKYQLILVTPTPSGMEHPSYNPTLNPSISDAPTFFNEEPLIGSIRLQKIDYDDIMLDLYGITSLTQTGGLDIYLLAKMTERFVMDQLVSEFDTKIEGVIVDILSTERFYLKRLRLFFQINIFFQHDTVFPFSSESLKDILVDTFEDNQKAYMKILNALQRDIDSFQTSALNQASFTFLPSNSPSSKQPTAVPSQFPILRPSNFPSSKRPTVLPSQTPTFQPSNSPSSENPTTTPTQCQDDFTYRSRYGFACHNYAHGVCSNIDDLNFTIEEVHEIKMRCKKSCALCALKKIPSTLPSKQYTTLPSENPGKTFSSKGSYNSPRISVLRGHTYYSIPTSNPSLQLTTASSSFSLMGYPFDAPAFYSTSPGRAPNFILHTDHSYDVPSFQLSFPPSIMPSFFSLLEHSSDTTTFNLPKPHSIMPSSSILLDQLSDTPTFYPSFTAIVGATSSLPSGYPSDKPSPYPSLPQTVILENPSKKPSNKPSSNPVIDFSLSPIHFPTKTITKTPSVLLSSSPSTKPSLIPVENTFKSLGNVSPNTPNFPQFKSHNPQYSVKSISLQYKKLNNKPPTKPFLKTSFPTTDSSMIPWAKENLCQDDRTYMSRFGYGCLIYSRGSCYKMSLIGFTQTEIHELITRCKKSCGTCQIFEEESHLQSRSDLFLPSHFPSRNPLLLSSLVPTGLFGMSTPCHDDSSYRSRLNFACHIYAHGICNSLSKLGLILKEIYEIKYRCKKSCGTCGIYEKQSMSPSRHYSTQTLDNHTKTFISFPSYLPSQAFSSSYSTKTIKKLSTSENDLMCKDDPFFLDQRYGLSCQQCNIVCDKLLDTGYSYKEVQEITNHCKFSCRGCHGLQYDVKKSLSETRIQNLSSIPSNLPSELLFVEMPTAMPLDNSAYSDEYLSTSEKFWMCKDNPSFCDQRYGLSCQQHYGVVCKKLGYFGFNDEEVQEIINHCKFSCKKCQEIRERFNSPSQIQNNTFSIIPSHRAILLTEYPTKIPLSGFTNAVNKFSRSEYEYICKDDPHFYDQHYGFSCQQHNGTVCKKLGYLGYTDKEVQEIIDRCKFSCKICKIDDVIVPASKINAQNIKAFPSYFPSENFVMGYPTVILSSYITKNVEELQITNHSWMCKDDSYFHDRRYGLSCQQHNGIMCEKLVDLGYSDEEVEEIYNHCKFSCKRCQKKISNGTKVEEGTNSDRVNDLELINGKKKDIGKKDESKSIFEESVPKIVLIPFTIGIFLVFLFLGLIMKQSNKKVAIKKKKKKKKKVQDVFNERDDCAWVSVQVRPFANEEAIRGGESSEDDL